MKDHATHGNGVGHVKVNYEGETYLTTAGAGASSIMEYMHQDKPGELMVLKFIYEYDLNRFFNVLNDNKKFRRIPAFLYNRVTNTTLYGDNIENIECRAINSTKPIEIVRMKPVYDDDEQDEAVTVYARRIDPEEMLICMPDEVIRYNELCNDKYKLKKIRGYSERVERIFGPKEEDIWENIPGVGRYNRLTGEIEDY